MRLTDKHTSFENDSREMFVGKTIRAVIYGELRYYADEEDHNIIPEPFYKTQYPDIDTLDYSIYFKTDDKTIYITWDTTFVCYGLRSMQIDLTEQTNDYEQKWDVSNEPTWANLIGQTIKEFKILWDELTPLDASEGYPQAFEIITELESRILVSAAEFKEGERDELYTLMDNLLVTTNIGLARELKLIS